jgi:GT2 family glycosyltransferase
LKLDQTLYSIKISVPAPIRAVYRDLRAWTLSLGLARNRDFVQPEAEIQASREVSIIIAIKDQPEFVERCLASVARYAAESEVILVDDASELPLTISMLDHFAAKYGWTLLRNQRSRGHSQCCGMGAEKATRKYLCLLNSDTVVTPWSWYAAKEAMESDPTIGVTGPTTSHSATVQQIRRAMHCRHYWNDSQIFSFAEQYISGLKPRAWVEIPQAGGFAFFLSHELWNRLGGFDENLPDYGNESELCVRVRKLGLRIVWTQNSYIHHFGGQSYGKLGAGMIYQKSRAGNEYIAEKYKNDTIRCE